MQRRGSLLCGSRVTLGHGLPCNFLLVSLGDTLKDVWRTTELKNASPCRPERKSHVASPTDEDTSLCDLAKTVTATPTASRKACLSRLQSAFGHSVRAEEDFCCSAWFLGSRCRWKDRRASSPRLCSTPAPARPRRQTRRRRRRLRQRARSRLRSCWFRQAQSRRLTHLRGSLLLARRCRRT
jgi:hypothetical protein